MYANTLKKDLLFGGERENFIHRYIDEYFKCNSSKTGRCNTFDFIDDDLKLIFELKSRRTSKNKYYDTMIGANKVTEGYKLLEKGYKIYFLFNFTDRLCAYELTKTSIKDSWFRKGGRKDRGRYEFKNYCFIPNKLLFDVLRKNGSSYYVYNK